MRELKASMGVQTEQFCEIANARLDDIQTSVFSRFEKHSKLPACAFPGRCRQSWTKRNDGLNCVERNSSESDRG